MDGTNMEQTQHDKFQLIPSMRNQFRAEILGLATDLLQGGQCLIGHSQLDVIFRWPEHCLL
jgi:hypothetical protein